MFNRAFLVLSVFLSVSANNYYSVTHKLDCIIALEQRHNCVRLRHRFHTMDIVATGKSSHYSTVKFLKALGLPLFQKFTLHYLLLYRRYFVISYLACVFLPEFSRCFKMFRKSLEILREFWEIFWDFLRFSENVFYRRNIWAIFSFFLKLVRGWPWVWGGDMPY